MLRHCLCVLAGAYALGFCRQLPPDPALLASAVVAAACLLLRQLRPFGLLLVGAVLAAVAIRSAENDRLSPGLAAEPVTAAVRISDFPENRRGAVRFIADVVDEPALPARIRLSWYDAPAVPRIGESWLLKVKLRRPRGLANPAGFDYELWLTRQRIGATGYVVADPANGRLNAAAVDRRAVRRLRLAERILRLCGDNDASAVLLAISVGARHRITREQWERYAVSGTTHLMAISGLHIGLAAAGAWVVFRVALSAFCRHANVRDLALVAAMGVAYVYAEVSGFAVPARRALLMALLVSAAILLRRQLGADKIIAVSCLAVVVIDPLVIHAPGFKLSFAAVAVLLWCACRRSFETPCNDTAIGRGWAAFKELPGLQLSLLFGLFPLTVLIFGRVSWLAPAVNLLVLPLFNLVTVPSALLGLALDGPLAAAGDRLLGLAWHSVRLMLGLVAGVAQWPPARSHVAGVPPLMLPVVLLPALWAAAPRGFPGRRLAWMAAVAVLMYRPPPPPPGCADLVTLDVGQGLSAVLRTTRRVMIFDTGPSFRGGSDAGQLVLVPYLRAMGIERVDLLVLSHDHDDHAGGAESLDQAIDVTQVMGGARVASLDRAQHACRSGQAWTWDGIRFGVMHPGLYPRQDANDASCVIEVAIGAYRILFTGDIESAVERHLVRISALTAADIVIVPHHGSRTSSVPAFVDQLGPVAAIVSAGYLNRWGFPRPEVVERWQRAGAAVVNTATSGAIHYRVCADSGVHLVSEHRMRQQRVWHDAVIR